MQRIFSLDHPAPGFEITHLISLKIQSVHEGRDRLGIPHHTIKLRWEIVFLGIPGVDKRRVLGGIFGIQQNPGLKGLAPGLEFAGDLFEDINQGAQVFAAMANAFIASPLPIQMLMPEVEPIILVESTEGEVPHPIL
jgi:hypothetical protein